MKAADDVIGLSLTGVGVGADRPLAQLGAGLLAVGGLSG